MVKLIIHNTQAHIKWYFLPLP
ncbi:unnamed protein product [Gulo gulo]|uniref:Uncharacterized protein n=1 Tax=Gulo gulo TaxID=48420 RepID=A0A9X9PTD2_GULGU|nr:unnamed protein product [Gulo gulo]